MIYFFKKIINYLFHRDSLKAFSQEDLRDLAETSLFRESNSRSISDFNSYIQDSFKQENKNNEQTKN